MHAAGLKSYLGWPSFAVEEDPAERCDDGGNVDKIVMSLARIRRFFLCKQKVDSHS